MKCDRCDAELDDNWQREEDRGSNRYGGVCDNCGDNLCFACGGQWSEDGVCQLCLEELGILYDGEPCADTLKEIADGAVENHIEEYKNMGGTFNG